MCISSVQLHLMFGVIAVGMSCGHVYLVDLRLDDDVEEFDEWNPSHLEIVDADNPDIASLRSRARDDGAHMAFELGGMCCLLVLKKLEFETKAVHSQEQFINCRFACRVQSYASTLLSSQSIALALHGCG